MEYHDSTEFDWLDDSYVKLQKLGLHTIELQANRSGLLSLAHQLIRLADEDWDSVFYDTDPGDLEVGSLCLQITRLDVPGRRLPSDEMQSANIAPGDCHASLRTGSQ